HSRRRGKDGNGQRSWSSSRRPYPPLNRDPVGIPRALAARRPCLKTRLANELPAASESGCSLRALAAPATRFHFSLSGGSDHALEEDLDLRGGSTPLACPQLEYSVIGLMMTRPRRGLLASLNRHGPGASNRCAEHEPISPELFQRTDNMTGFGKF